VLLRDAGGLTPEQTVYSNAAAGRVWFTVAGRRCRLTPAAVLRLRKLTDSTRAVQQQRSTGCPIKGRLVCTNRLERTRTCGRAG
jgi:hypothetical protein